MLLMGAAELSLLGASACSRRSVMPPPHPAGKEKRAGASITPLLYDEHGGLFLEARVAGAPPRLLVLDTGASHSTISTDYVRELGLSTVGTTMVEGTAGATSATKTRSILEIPDVFVGEIDFVVYAFGSYEPRCVGILGFEVLHRSTFWLRYRRGEVHWGTVAPAGYSIPMRLDGRIPRIEAELDGLAMDFRLDTGATLAPGPDYYVNLAPQQARALRLQERVPAKVFKATGTGGAVLELPVHRLQRFVLGGTDIPGPYAIVQPPVGYFAASEAVGFLGNSVLDKLDPHFDYVNRRLTLFKNDSVGS
jgi:predicted aspartyl protease